MSCQYSPPSFHSTTPLTTNPPRRIWRAQSLLLGADCSWGIIDEVGRALGMGPMDLEDGPDAEEAPPAVRCDLNGVYMGGLFFFSFLCLLYPDPTDPPLSLPIRSTPRHGSKARLRDRMLGAASQSARARLAEGLTRLEGFQRYDDGRETSGACLLVFVGDGRVWQGRGEVDRSVESSLSQNHHHPTPHPP